MKNKFFLTIICLTGIISLSGQALSEKKVLSEIKSSDIPTEIRARFEGYLSANELIISYEKYNKKGVIPHADRLLLFIPDGNQTFLGFEKNKEAKINRNGRSYLAKHVSVRNGRTHTDFILGMKTCVNGRTALLTDIIRSYMSYGTSVRLNTWNSKDIPVLETPFDFTANYCEGKFFSLDASYYNLMLAIQVDDSKLKDPLPLTELNPIMDRFVSLFHGYEKAEKITPVDYLNCEITSEKDSTVKVTWSFKEKFKELADQLWILAVSNNGDLAMESNTVTIKLPEKEKETKTSLTFYFISEDGKSYSAQTVKIPENLKSRK